MKFFFPDSQDQIDPSFDFETEQRSPFRVRQRDDRYAHESCTRTPYDGILISKSIVEGSYAKSRKYTLAQRHRLYRLGVRGFFRLDEIEGPRVLTMGDCGAFSYVAEEVPPFSVEDVLDFYEECRFDLGLSVDHAILGYRDSSEPFQDDATASEWEARRELTLTLAADFFRLALARHVAFETVGVAQGWCPSTYAASVKTLQDIGYRRIALGGLVPQKTGEINAVLSAVNDLRDRRTQIHLLGITRPSNMKVFQSLGVTSFDSTSPFRQAFKDDRDNYHTDGRTFTALRVPQVDGNPKLKARILAGEVDQTRARDLERQCLDRLVEFDRGEISAGSVLDALRTYEQLHDGRRDRSVAYLETLEASPWKECGCGICETVGIQVMVFRGTERNKRRGFHNIYVFSERLQKEFGQRKNGRRVHALQ